MKRTSMSKTTMFFVKLLIIVLILAGLVYLVKQFWYGSYESLALLNPLALQSDTGGQCRFNPNYPGCNHSGPSHRG